MKTIKAISQQALGSAGRVVDRAMLLATPFVDRPRSLVFTFHSLGPRNPSQDAGSADHSYRVFASFLKWFRKNTEVVPVAEVAQMSVRN
jgi:hypothetical protein